jgi:hypothetical protein
MPERSTPKNLLVGSTMTAPTTTGMKKPPAGRKIPQAGQ